jgi:hypothetical protein
MALKRKSSTSEVETFTDIQHLEYNTQRNHLRIPEYGRSIQKWLMLLFLSKTVRRETK